MKKTILVFGLTLTLAGLAGPAHAQLTRPDGPGRFPAVVLMHGCGGVRPFHIAWGERLKAAGYVALVVDSFGPRGIGNICNNGSPLVPARIEDAYTALHYLKGLAFVDGSRIALMGWSHGAWTTLEAVATPHPESFKAAIAMYPLCRDAVTVLTVPTLVLVGAFDDWTPAKPCESLNARIPSLDLTVYPGVHHGFDDPRFNRGGIVDHGHRLEYNNVAAQDAHEQVLRFLSQQLGK
jgi:dienelactone hydrolase